MPTKRRSKYVRYSRMAKKENKRIVRQSMMLMVVSVFILVALVVYGIPALVNYAGFLGEVKTSTEPIDSNDTVAPFAPQLNIAAEATTSGVINISGYAEAEATVALYHNNDKKAEVVVNDEGVFEFFGIELEEGVNEFAARATDVAGNESPKSPSTSVVFDDIAPTIELTDLVDGQQVTNLDNDELLVKGTTEVGADVYVNDRLTQVDLEGVFSRKIKLNEGDNTIKVRAVDLAGNADEVEVRVKYDR